MPKRFPRQLENRRAQCLELPEETIERRRKLVILDHARHQAEAVGLAGADLLARQDELGRPTHADELRQRHHGNRREAAQLDFRLSKLSGFRGQHKVAETGKLQAAAQTVSVHRSDFHAIGFGKMPKHRVKCGEHFSHALGAVIGDLRSGGEGFGTLALKNKEIALGKSAHQHRIQRFHHRNVKNV